MVEDNKKENALIGASIKAAFLESVKKLSKEDVIKLIRETPKEELEELGEDSRSRGSDDDKNGIESAAKVNKLIAEGGSYTVGVVRNFLLRTFLLKALYTAVYGLIFVVLIVCLAICARLFVPEMYCSTADWFTEGDTYNKCIDTIIEWKRQKSP